MIIKKMGHGETINYAIEKQHPKARMLIAMEGDAGQGDPTSAILLGEGENVLIIDAVAAQEDSEKIIDIYCGMGGTYTEEKSDMYVANIIIPPRGYQYIDTGEVDDKDQAIIKKQALPLDMEAVTLILWPLDQAILANKERKNEENENTAKGEMQS